MALFHLDRMRASEVYREATTIGEMVRLEEKYRIRGTVGDQVTIASMKRRLPLYNMMSGLADPAGLGAGGAVLHPPL